MRRLLLSVFLFLMPACGQARLEITLVNSYPEVRAGGRPFFIHSAAFFYARIPRENWEPFLRKHREMGINTLDLYVPWNWHEPAEGQLDFTGRTNPRRDIKGLLDLAEKLNLKVILRPGPVILNEWKHGGYPDWLLARPEYNMPLADRLEGRYAPMSNLAPRNSEEASRGWLENAAHMAHARRWMEAVARELIAPHSARQGGAILFVQLDDDQALGRSNYNGPLFWRYMHELRRMLAAGGADLPVFINPTDMRVSAAGWDASFEKPIAAMGQWYQPAARPEATGNVPGMPLRPEDFSEIEFFTETLKTQPGFPAMIVEFQAGWYCPAYDIAPRASDPANTLLAARTLFENGLKGLNYFPLQDTVYPAGYEVPWTNRHYAWEAALKADGSDGPKAGAVRRNGRLIQGLGPQLAAAHKWADIGIVYALSAYPQEKLTAKDIQRISGAAIALQQALRGAGFSAEYVDPLHATQEQLRRYRVLMMPVDESFEISDEAVRRLGAARSYAQFIFYPRLPGLSFSGGSGPIGAPNVAGSLEEAVSRLDKLEAQAAGRPRRMVIVKNADPGQAPAPLLSIQVANNTEKPRYAFVFATNPDYGQPKRLKLSVLDPQSDSERIELPEFTLRAKDSVALPIRLPLCNEDWRPEAGDRRLGTGLASSLQPPASSPRCQDELVYATGELTGFRRIGSRVELTFYAPEQIEARLRLERSRARGASQVRTAQEFSLRIPAGEAPEYIRTLTVSLQPSTGKPSSARLPQQSRPALRDEGAVRREPLVGARGSAVPARPPKGEAIAYRYDFDSDGEDEWVLENQRLRAVFSPNSGGRAFIIQDKATGDNSTTTVGAFRDRFSYYEQAPGASKLRLRGAFGLHNRPFKPEIVVERGPNTSIRLSYDAPDVLPAGARIVKTFTLPADRDFLLADYEVSLNQPSSSQQFISVNSLPFRQVEQGANWAIACGNGRIVAIAWDEGAQARGSVDQQPLSSLFNLAFPAMEAERVRQHFRIAWRTASGPPERARQVAEELAEQLKRLPLTTHP